MFPIFSAEHPVHRAADMLRDSPFAKTHRIALLPSSAHSMGLVPSMLRHPIKIRCGQHCAAAFVAELAGHNEIDIVIPCFNSLQNEMFERRRIV
jgi:hypothetical protein